MMNVPITNPPLHMHHHQTRGLADDTPCSLDFSKDTKDCYGRDYRPFYVSTPGPLASSDILINDIRPYGSPPLEWYMSGGLHVLDQKSSHTRRPLSMFNAVFADLITPQKHLIMVPTKRESFLHFSKSFPVTGALVMLGHHGHPLQQMLIFSGNVPVLSSSRLTMSQSCILTSAWVPRDTAQSGFESNDALKLYVLRSLRPQISDAELNQDSRLLAAVSNLRCVGSQQKITHRGMAALTKMDTLCKPWSFSRGDPLTILTTFSASETDPRSDYYHETKAHTGHVYVPHAG